MNCEQKNYNDNQNNQAEKATQTAQATRATQAPQATRATQAPQAARATQTTQAAQATQATQTAQAARTPQASQATQASQAGQASQAAQTPRAPQTAQPAQASQNRQTASKSNTTQAVKTSSANMNYYYSSGADGTSKKQNGTFQNANGSYRIPIWLIVVGFIINPMVGFAFLAAKFLEDKTPNTPANQTSSGGNVKNASGNAGAPKRKFKTKKNIAIVLTILGAILIFSGITTLPDDISYLIWCIQERGTSTMYAIEDIASTLLTMASGGGLLALSHIFRTGDSIRRKIAAIVGNSNSMPVQEIAAALSMSPKKTMKYLRQCIDYGIFGEMAYIDMRSECLVVRGPAPMSKKEREKQAKDAEDAARKAAEEAAKMSDYDKILKELREVNDKIPGAEMSEKIDRLEELTAKIFNLLQQHPEKKYKMNKFMDYYLPTSLKLLQQYAQLDAQDIEGANISKSKKQIEDTMDTMVTAFEKQLDKMFYSDSIDISADIAAMQKMMHADGLVKNDLFDGLKN